MLRAILTATVFSFLLTATPGGAHNDASTPELSASMLTANSVERLSLAEKKLAFDQHVAQVYQQAGLQKAGLSLPVFKKAYTGYQNFRAQGLLSAEKQLLTVVDFTKPSDQKRMWIVDLAQNKVLFHNLVAHGRNTGNVKAEKFSNELNSNMSSMGFYVTDKTYYGKHGLSLRLSGMDEAYNSKAMERAIVLHGADYVSDDFIKQYGRLGRSLGCPAVPRAISGDVIELIKDNTTLYIHSADKTYTSAFLNTERAIESFAQQQQPIFEAEQV
jgi:hypothetical protein